MEKYAVLIFSLFYISFASAQPGPGNQSFVSFTASPECADSKNGKIRIMIEDDIPPPWSLPFDYRYENLDNGHIGDGVCIGNITEILNLEKGNYKIWVELDVSCSAVGFAQVTEVPNTLDLILNVPNTNMCNKGKIVADLQGGTPMYSYLWSNGSTQALIDDLAPGEYCVTATDSKGCIAEGCELIKSHAFTVDISDFKNVSECITNYSSSDGEINIEITGPVGENYTYKWSGPNGFAATQKNINALKPGEYKLTVSNTFGCSVILTKKLCCCETDPDNQGSDPNACFTNSGSSAMKLDAIIQHPTSSYASDGSIYPSITGTGAKGSLSYTWSGPSGFTSFKKDIVELSEGNYCLTVTDGCASVSKCFEIYPCKIEFEQVDACKGYDSGKIIVKLFNPNLFLYLISNNGVTLPSSPPTIYQIYEIDNLSSGTTYNIEVTLGECFKNESFKIGAKDLDSKFVSIPGIDNKCRYDLYCGDNLIQKDHKILDPTPNWSSQLNVDKGYWVFGGGGCDVDFGCSQLKLFSGYYPLTDRSCGEYKMLIQVAHEAGVLNDIPYFHNLQEVSEYDDCATIRYCSGNFAFAQGFNPLWKDCGGIQVNGPLGCYKNDCCLIDGGDIEFCLCDIVPDYLKEYCNFNYNNENPQCYPKYKRIIELILMYDYLLTQPGFQDSELEKFLREVKKDKELLKKSNCGFVSYCSNTFKKIFDNLDQVDCDPVFRYECYTLPDDPDLHYWEWLEDVCYLKETGDGEQVAICNKYGVYTETPINTGIDYYTQNPNVNNLIQKEIPEECGNSKFIKLSDTYKGNDIDSRGIFEKDSLNYILALNGNSYRPSVADFANGVMLTDDWSKHKSIFVDESVESSVYNLYFQHNSESKVVTLNSNFLDINDLYQTETKVYVFGRMNGSMKVNSQIIANTDSLKYFLLEFDSTGLFHSVDLIKFNGNLSCSINSKSLTILGIKNGSSDTIKLNEATINTDNKLFAINENFSTGTINYTPRLPFLGNGEIIKTVSSLKDSIDFVVIKGNGIFYLPGNENLEVNNNEMLGLLIDHNNQVLKSFKFEFANIQDDEIALTSNNKGDFFLGITFTDSAVINNGLQYHSNGSKDILVMMTSKYDNNLYIRQFGNTNSETVMDLSADNDNLYIGGNLSGSEQKTIIGRIDFNKNSCIERTGYVAAMPISDFKANLPFAKKFTKKEYPKQKVGEALSIYPNPFSDMITVSLKNFPKAEKICIFDLLGQKVITLMVFEERQSISTTQLHPGYYIIGIEDEFGSVIAQKAIIKK
jgi:hypothetical protein